TLSLDPETSQAFKALSDAGENARIGLRRLGAHGTRAETVEEFVERVRTEGAERLRIIGTGGEAERIVDALYSPAVSIVSGPVLATGRREMLSVLREQAISRTLHRFGHLPADRHDDGEEWRWSSTARP